MARGRKKTRNSKVNNTEQQQQIRDQRTTPSASSSSDLLRRNDRDDNDDNKNYSPSPTTPPKMKKTPTKGSGSSGATGGFGQAVTSKITDYFSPIVADAVATKDGNGGLPGETVARRSLTNAFTADATVFPRQGVNGHHHHHHLHHHAGVAIEDESGCEDSGSGKENESWRASSPPTSPTRVAPPAPLMAGSAALGPISSEDAVGSVDEADAHGGSSLNQHHGHNNQIRAISGSGGNSSGSGSPLQPRRVVTRSHTAKGANASKVAVSNHAFKNNTNGFIASSLSAFSSGTSSMAEADDGSKGLCSDLRNPIVIQEPGSLASLASTIAAAEGETSSSVEKDVKPNKPLVAPVPSHPPSPPVVEGIIRKSPRKSTPPQSPPTPHKIKLLNERSLSSSSSSSGFNKGGSSKSSSAHKGHDASSPRHASGNSKAALKSSVASSKKLISSLSPKKRALFKLFGNEASHFSSKADSLLRQKQCQSSLPAQVQPSLHKGNQEAVQVQTARRNLIELLEEDEVNKQLPASTGKGVVVANAASNGVHRDRGNCLINSHAFLNGFGEGTHGINLKNKDKKVTDFFPIRRSARKCKNELEELKMSEIKTLLSKECCVGEEESQLGLIVKEYPEKGRGVEAARRFNKGDFVVEYVGDLIEGNGVAKELEAKYATDSSKGCYMYYFLHRGKHYCIDATAETGRLGRLVNHSRLKPNLQTKVVEVKNVPRLILVAKMDIEEGTELLYDYGDRSKESMSAHPWLAL